MRNALVGLGLLAAWAEVVHWRASRALVNAPAPGRSEAVVVLGCRNKSSTRANALNRWRVRAALRSIDHTSPDSVLVCSGGVTSDSSPVSEAALLARYAVDELGFTGPVLLEERSRSTWENIQNVIPLIDGRDRIKIVSNSLHAQKARIYLHRQHPDLANRLVRAADYRFGEAWPLKPLFAVHGLRILARTRRNTGQLPTS
ncbi:YdcF family protein, partial [Saccharopolyspora taberi]|uniref:YdcF family protein n=1 Tax=Saccharopolyspora taberi TaxID=60895 RepID=UPI0031D07FC6